MKRLWQNYSLSITLFTLFFLSWAAQAIFQVGIEGETWAAFFAEMFANWQSEFLQLVFQVVLPVFLLHRNSPVSRDGDDEIKRIVTAIQLKVDALTTDQDSIATIRKEVEFMTKRWRSAAGSTPDD